MRIFLKGEDLAMPAGERSEISSLSLLCKRRTAKTEPGRNGMSKLWDNADSVMRYGR
jgi:hypothetical protein